MNRLVVADEQLSHDLALSGFGGLELEGEPLSSSSEDVAALLRQIWSAIYRNWWLIASNVAATTLAAIAITMLMTPKYAASSSVQIEQQEAKVLDTDDTSPIPQAQDADRFLQTQQDILESRALAQRVVAELGLARNDKFVLAMQAKPVDRPAGVLNLADTKKKQVLELVEKNLSVDIPRNSRIATITFRSPDPVLAARVANSYAQDFILWNINRKFENSAYARNFLQEQLAIAKQKLEDSERAMIAYARKAGLIDASAGVSSNGVDTTQGPRSLTTSNLVQLNSSYIAARAARMAAEQKWRTASLMPLMSLPEVLSNPAIQQLTQHRAELQAAYQQELQRRQPGFPAMKQAQAQIAELDKQINVLATNLRNTIRDDYQTALKQEQALSGGVSSLKADTLSEQDRSVQYNILKRETDTNRTMYDGLLQRYKEVSAAAGVSASNISIIDKADVPVKPVSPRALLNVALGLLFGCLMSAVLVFLREKFDDVVRSPDEVTQKLGLRMLNAVPLLRGGDTPEAALGDPRSALAESYAALRASLDLATSSGAPRSLLVTSSRQSEGKSTTAFAIARDFAMIGRRVLLVDADLRKPSLHRAMFLENSRGLTNLLTRHSTLEQVVQPSGHSNLAFIPSGPLPPNPAELLSGPLFRGLIDEALSQYDMIVVDGPPILGLADPVLLAAQVEAAVFVVEANGSHRGHAKAALRRLMAANRNILGAVLTKFDARKVGYGYGYGYGSYYSYGVEGQARLT